MPDSLYLPPEYAKPYSVLPTAVNWPSGYAPSVGVTLKSCTTVSLPPAHLKMVPYACVPPNCVMP